MNRKKVLIISGIAVVVLLLVYFAIKSDTTSGMQVYADAVANRNLVEKVSASGRIQPKTKVNITAEVTAEIIDLRVREGDRVKAGDLLIVLDTVQAQSDADQARYAVNEISARLDGAQSTLDQAKEEYERQQHLYDNNLTSETAFKNAKYAYLNAKASFQAMQAQASQAQSRLEKQLDNLTKTKIVAPMSGIVTLVDCEVGEIAPAQTAFTQGKTLMTISDLDVFEVEVEVDETEIAKVDLGQPADIEVDAIPDTIFQGRVVEIGNTAIMSNLGTQDQSTNFKVKVVFNDKNANIRPGMSATVDVRTAERNEAVTVPFSSVVMRSYDLDSLERARAAESANPTDAVQAAENPEDSTAVADKKPEELKGVFVIRDGKARFVQIETGIADQKHIEVTEGLTPGDSVISGPYSILRTIRDGDVVEIMRKPEKGMV